MDPVSHACPQFHLVHPQFHVIIKVLYCELPGLSIPLEKIGNCRKVTCLVLCVIVIADLYVVVLFRKDIYRLNLELGQFLSPFESEASEINKVAINDTHRLVVVGTREGRVEAWDPRSRARVGTLDCALSSVTPDTTPE